MENSEDNKQEEVEYALDLEWLRNNNRPFINMARGRVCPECRQQAEGEATAEGILSHISQCCAQSPDYVNSRQPVMEAIFRLFLLKANKPMNIEEISSELGRLHVGETRHVDAKSLQRLLNSDNFYGIRPMSQRVEIG